MVCSRRSRSLRRFCGPCILPCDPWCSKGRHEGNEEEDCGCSNDKSTSDYIISEEFNHHWIPNAPLKKNRLPVVAYEITAATNPIIATPTVQFFCPLSVGLVTVTLGVVGLRETYIWGSLGKHVLLPVFIGCDGHDVLRNVTLIYSKN